LGFARNTDKSVKVEVLNFPCENLRGPHVELFSTTPTKEQQDNKIKNMPPNLMYNVGSPQMMGSNAIVRYVSNLYRNDGNPAHITVYYGSDAKQRLNFFKNQNEK
jgi:hypothetical protein